MKTNKPTESEHKIQSAFFSWIDIHQRWHPDLQLFYSIPNGANKSITARMKFQREGLRSGVPDCHLPVAKLVSYVVKYHSLYLEFKSQKGVISETQKWWHARLRDEGHLVEVVRSWTDAVNITIDYLDLNIPKI